MAVCCGAAPRGGAAPVRRALPTPSSPASSTTHPSPKPHPAAAVQVFIGQGCHDALPLLLRFAGLRSLDLPAASYAHIDWSAPSAARLLTGFTGLRELTLRDGGITDGLLAVVGQLRGLKLLSISTPDPLPRAFHNEVRRPPYAWEGKGCRGWGTCVHVCVKACLPVCWQESGRAE